MSEHNYNNSSDDRHFLSDDESGASAQIAKLLSTQFSQYETTHRAVETLGVVASGDSRRTIRRASASALNSVVNNHLGNVRIRTAILALKKAVEAEVARDETDPEVLTSLMTAYKDAEAFRKNLPVRFRAATLDDAGSMAELATREIPGGQGDVDWRTDLFRQGIEDGNAVSLVAELNGEIVGMAYTSLDDNSASRLEFLAVAKRWARCGIGGKLLQQTMSAVRNLGISEMQLKAFGDSTQDYYRRFGFTGPRDQLLITMTRSLDSLSIQPSTPTTPS